MKSTSKAARGRMGEATGQDFPFTVMKYERKQQKFYTQNLFQMLLLFCFNLI